MSVTKIKSANCFGVECAARELYDQKGSISGYMEAEIKCLSDLHIGNGSAKGIENALVKTVMRYDGNPVIPGSSLKGSVRAVASAVSNSCHTDCYDKVPYEKKCDIKSKHICITCSMFGTLGYASRVEFSDFLPAGDFSITTVYKAAPYQGKGEQGKRMFYRTKPLNPASPRQSYLQKDENTKTINIEAVSEGAVFKGKIFFRDLTEEQLSLLMFSLGLDDTVDLLVGGFRYDGMGRIKITPINYKSDLNKSPKELAEQYPNYRKCEKQIKQLREQNIPIAMNE